MRKVVGTLAVATVLLFAVSALAQTQPECTPKIAWNSLCSKRSEGDAIASEILEGKTFSNKDEVGVAGTMVNNGAITFDPGISYQTIPEGYHNGSGTVKGDANLVSGNIKTGATIFGVTGTSIEASGTATAGQVLEGKTFSNDSGPATGIMKNVGAQIVMHGTSAQVITEGHHNGSGSVAGDAGLVTGNIRSGTTIFDVEGDPNVVDTSLGDANSEHILLGSKAYVDGALVTGTQGLFWGCRPGIRFWNYTWCQEACYSYYGGDPSKEDLCDSLCESLANVLVGNILEEVCNMEY